MFSKIEIFVTISGSIYSFMYPREQWFDLFRACLVTNEEFIDLIILHYHCNNDLSLGICIVESFALIFVYIDAYN